MSRATLILTGRAVREKAMRATMASDPAGFFAARYEPELNTGCWLWTGAMAGDGYGYVQLPFTGTKTRAHRFSLALHGTAVGTEDVVLHRCDTPACVNPAHLRVGTHADNVADMHAKGRARGPAGKRWTLPPGSRSGEKHNRFGQRKAECVNGHPFTPDNTRITAKGSQRCRACERTRALAYHHASKGRAK
jgi:hypothetical protein